VKRRVIVYAVLLLLVTTIPYLIAWAQQGEDWRFTGFLFGVEDGNSYLGKMRLGGRGVWDFFLFYTPEPHDTVPLVFLPYIVPGQIVGQIVPETDPAHTTALIITFHGIRILCAALLIFTLDRFIAEFIRSQAARFTALVLATIGGGLGWIVTFTGPLPPELYIPEGFGFLILFGLPHLALARAALLGGLLILIRSLEPRRRKGREETNPEPRRHEGHEGGNVGAQHTALLHSVLSPQSSVLLPILAGLCWLIVGLSVPFYLVILYCILGAWGLAAWVRQRKFPMELFARCGIAAGITLPLFLYYTIAFSTNPAFAVWSAQNSLPSPPPLQYVFAYCVIGIPALFGLGWAWGRARLRTRYALLIGWTLIVPMLIYLPINVQRRMAEAVIVPLAILAAAGIEVWVQQRPKRRRFAWLWVVTASLSAAFLLLGGVIAASNPGRPLFRPAAEVTALNWLNAHASPDAVALSSVETGNVLPAYTHLRPFMGHGPETLEWQHKTVLLEEFYRSEMTTAERATLYDSTCLESVPTLCAAPIDYLIYGPLERALASTDVPPNWLEEWTLIYDEAGYQIYERIEDEM
jgi:hypothetical protein